MLYKEGMPLEVISKLTGLSVEKLKKLKDRN